MLLPVDSNMNDLFDLTGRTALVTGSTRGLGLALARALGDAGARVGINGRSLETCEAAAAGIDGAFAVPFDVTDEDAIAAGVAADGADRHPRQQRGHPAARTLEQFSLDQWRQVIDANLTSAFLVARAVAPQMIERGRGKIVNTCSVTSEVGPRDDRPVHSVEGRTEDADASDVRRLGAIRDPGQRHRPRLFPHRINTVLQEDPEFDAWIRGRVPAGRWGEPSELGGAVVFLASAASDFVNGQILYVDGGLLAVL